MLWVFATLLPLCAFVVEVLAGRRLGKGTAYLATAAIGTSALLSTVGLLDYVMFKNPDSILAAHHDHHEGEGDSHGHDHGEHGGNAESGPKEGAPAHGHESSSVIEQGSFAWATLVKEDGSGPRVVRIGYRIDNITVLMFFMVTLIATCIHVYSIGYMSHEERFSRFFTYLSLFCFSMLALVISDNFFQVFMCWELVGVCSYFLIGFYYEKRSASNAANKAFITNRVGDVGFIVGLMVIWANFGTFRFSEIFTPEGLLNPDLSIDPLWLTVAGIGIFVGCVGKSAQFPLHVWLPDAMEGPTPVSALIHAATMVAAGVYFVARSFPLFTPEALLVIVYVGGITAFVAATIAIVATDIKKALAYSTVSQLGYMMLALGIGGWVAGLMHLITHAFFKALLFLCSGSVIHGTGTQEMPEMGGLIKKMPITAFAMLVGVLAIAGFPYMSGFYSKDAIIAQVLAYGESNPEHTFVMLLPAVSAGITAFYMFRLWFMTFMGKPRDPHVYDHAHESPKVMWVPLAILSFFAVFAAGLPFWHVLENFIAFGQPAAANAGSVAGLQARSHELHGMATLIATTAAVVGFSLAASIYWLGILNPEDGKRQFPKTYNLLVNKWYFDELYRFLLVRPAFVLSKACHWFDRVVIDGIVNGTARETVRLSAFDGRFDKGIVDGIVNLVADAIFGGGTTLHRVQSGWLRGYVMYIAVGSAGLFALGAFLFS